MTDDERRQLRDIERGLMASDPQLVQLMSGGTYGLADSTRRRPGRIGGLALILFVDLMALAVIVLAVATGRLVLIFASTLVTLLAIVLHVVRRKRADGLTGV